MYWVELFLDPIPGSLKIFNRYLISVLMNFPDILHVGSAFKMGWHIDTDNQNIDKTQTNNIRAFLIEHLNSALD